MSNDLPAIPPLWTAHLSGIGGRIKTYPEDFEVEEVPAYLPCGEGEHLYLWIEKRSMGAEFFLRQIARRLNLSVGEVGSAGLKDRHAVTRQMISVPGSCEPLLSQVEGDGIRLLKVSRHTNKLKSGHLRGNRFRILIREVHPQTEQLLPGLLDHLRKQGVPNFYGSQRFGREGETFRLGMDLLQGRSTRRVQPFLRRLALSAVQSALFNHYVAARMRDGVLRRVLPGDVLMKWPFGGMFVAQEVAVEQSRLEAGEIVPGGPMFGKKMFRAAGEAMQREETTLGDFGLTLTSFQGFGKLLSGTRRYSLIYVEDLVGVREPEGVRLSFTLPAGSYATVLLREIMHQDKLEVEEE